MKINEQATLFAHKEIFIQAAPEAVWKIHTDINQWGQWQPAIANGQVWKAPCARLCLFNGKLVVSRSPRRCKL